MDKKVTESKSSMWSNNCFDLNDCLNIPVHDHGYLENSSDGSAPQIAELRFSDSLIANLGPHLTQLMQIKVAQMLEFMGKKGRSRVKESSVLY